ncbi:MAG: metallophosphoesterase family protein [Prevotella sp.]
MLRKIFTILLLLLATVNVFPQQSLKFHDGQFKIVQFTDIHYKLHNRASAAALQCINEVIEREQPDLVILTGDVVYSRPADSTLMTVANVLDGKKVPWIMLFGNHDEERGLSNRQLNNLLTQCAYNVQPDPMGSTSLDGVVRIKGSKGNGTAVVLYCFDSHNHSRLSTVKGYAWIEPQQVEWYRKTSQRITTEAGDTLPSLAFFHIPLPEFREAAENMNEVMVGNRMEKVCCPELNTGLFATMRIQGDVMGIFCGHDHDNDFAVMHKDILLAYGRFTGGNTEYNHLRNGARVIVLHEGERRFDTWIDVRGGGKEFEVTYPKNFIKDNWRARPITENNNTNR